MPKEKEHVVLPREHMSVLGYMRYRHVIPCPTSACRQKNVKESIKYRNKGNDLYKMKHHDDKIHEKIWKTYTQCITLAPNHSQELAFGFGNRSALLFHLKKFKECIKDCDEAIVLSKNDLFKVKLLTRKAECLFLLNIPTEDVCNKALQLLNSLKVNHQIEKNYTDKLKNILIASNVMPSKEKSRHREDRKEYFEMLSNFPCSDEVTCASNSVAIRYSKKWGRHIVATEDIRPGEILAVEKPYYTYINQDGKYLYCSNCAKHTWSSIPCGHCIDNVYCSKSCRSEAWIKYHRWECAIYPFIRDIEKDIGAMLLNLRLILKGIVEIGGIDNMKKLLIDIDRRKDPRTKGFSNGYFQIDSIRSIYSLTKHYNADDYLSEQLLTEEACVIVELLARHSTFFQEQMKAIDVLEMFKNKDVIFLTKLLLHTQYITSNNAQHHFPCERILNSKQKRCVTTVSAFTSLINHSCDPNIHLALGKNNITFVYALKPIKKGTQLMICYNGQHFLNNTKEERQSYLEYTYNFNCRCLPCTENWSSICLPTVKAMSEVSPQLTETYRKILRNVSELKKLSFERGFKYSPIMVTNIIFYLEYMAEKITIYSADYQDIIEVLEKTLRDVFGYFHFTIPDDCFSF